MVSLKPNANIFRQFIKDYDHSMHSMVSCSQLKEKLSLNLLHAVSFVPLLKAWQHLFITIGGFGIRFTGSAFNYDMTDVMLQLLTFIKVQHWISGCLQVLRLNFS